LRQGILRHVSPAFAEDPLRVLRAMQFAARFKLRLAEDTAVLCHRLLPEATTLPCSRIWCEWQKWAHAEYPSWGLQTLKDSGWLSCYPELNALQGCLQDARWHPEGDVWIHTLQVCDQAARVAKRQKLGKAERELLLFAALCHDVGKPMTTFCDAEGHIHSPKHHEVGMQSATTFLQSIAAPKQLVNHAALLVYDHMAHLCGEPTARAIRRLAHRLEPVSIEMWEMLVEADASGRHPSPACRPARIWLEKAEALGSHVEKVKPIVTGVWLLARGAASGKGMGVIIKDAYEAQLDGLFDDEASAEQWWLAYAARDIAL